jgi:hypothetical protein
VSLASIVSDTADVIVWGPLSKVQGPSPLAKTKVRVEMGGSSTPGVRRMHFHGNHTSWAGKEL